MLHTTDVSYELNSSRTVLVSILTQMCEICAVFDAAYLGIPLAEISYVSE